MKVQSSVMDEDIRMDLSALLKGPDTVSTGPLTKDAASPLNGSRGPGRQLVRCRAPTIGLTTV